MLKLVHQLMFFSFKVKIESVELEFIFQLADTDFATRVRLDAQVEVLFIIGIKIDVLFELNSGGWLAEFEAELEVNLGAIGGTVTTGIRASAEVGDYTYTAKEERALKETNSSLAISHRDLDSSSLLDADWDLEFYANWDIPQWLEDIGKAIVEGLKSLWDGLKAVWDGLKDLVSAAWDAIKNIASEIGGAIAKVFGEISDALEDIADDVEKGIDAVSAFLDGKGLGVFGDLIGIGGEAIGNIIEAGKFSSKQSSTSIIGFIFNLC